MRTSVRLKKSNVVLIIIIFVILTLLTLGVQLPLFAMVAQSHRADAMYWLYIATIAWAITYGIIVFATIVAFGLVTKFRMQHREGMDPDVGSALKRIQIAAALLFVISTAALVTLAIFTLGTSPILYENPYCTLDPVRIGRRSIRLCFALQLVVCIWFVSRPVKRLREMAHEEKEELSAQEATSSAGSKNEQALATSASRDQLQAKKDAKPTDPELQEQSATV
jgi:hypothetical protein